MTRRRIAIGFCALIFIDTWTQISFKLASRQTGEFMMNSHWLRAAAVSPFIYAAIAGYLGAFLAWMTLLEHAPVGPAFAASHLEVVTVLMLSVLLFGEHLTAAKLAGAACIVTGIIMLSLSEARAPLPDHHA
ncbi:MAG: EamA family transporter [Acidobacteria bacterium]|nr:EamA family transporter [Acidobacteriota bacterium]MBV9069247.1 EamA family transporter [Acidobacteriota bacterium]MBV9184337.1 EamA family transporter [Acidobacteriota bacterium]